jgi:uncharacterized protein
VIGAHSVPRRLFAEMAKGGGGAEAIELLSAAQHSKQQLMLRGLLTEAQTVDQNEWRLASQGYDLLADAQRHDPVAANAVIRYPSVAAWVVRTLRALRGRVAAPGAEPVMLSAVAAAASIRARLPAEIEVPVRNGAVVLPSLGAAAADGSRAVVRHTGDSTEVQSSAGRIEIPADPHRDARGWKGLRRIRVGSLDAVVDDLDPFRMPTLDDLSGRLGGVQADSWAATFGHAWPLLDRHHPVVAAEVAAVVKVIVPRNVPPQGVVSSSSPETFGAVAMSPPPDGCALAETLAHEVQHLKLSALADVVTLTEPDDGSRYYAPWRDDPRPVNGLLQGAYAYLGVSGFWRRQRLQEEGEARIRADAEFERWRTATALVTGTLTSSGGLTADGMEFVLGMSRTLQSWLAEPVPQQARTRAREEAEQHRRRWESVNGPIPA